MTQTNILHAIDAIAVFHDMLLLKSRAYAQQDELLSQKLACCAELATKLEESMMARLDAALVAASMPMASRLRPRNTRGTDEPSPLPVLLETASQCELPPHDITFAQGCERFTLHTPQLAALETDPAHTVAPLLEQEEYTLSWLIRHAWTQD